MEYDAEHSAQIGPESESETETHTGYGNDQVSDSVQHHIQTLPPEILRGIYTVMPSNRPKRGLDQSLPPINEIQDIFDDLVAKAEEQGFGGFLDHIGQRELRVATMCSGTEAPLLALEMIAESFMRLFGKSFRMHHLFSAEIEPFKQSYIQRNFSPDVLFRDVTELVKEEATTAFGSIRAVPTNPDLLVAGFSCVDFSQLNAHKKSLEEMGESGHTFFPIFQYIKRCRPPLIILENVFGAPWSKIADLFKEIDYHGYHASIDTKNYYLPQTRERGYLLCIDQGKLNTEPPSNKSGKTSLLARTMKAFERPASSPITDFLLKQGDPRLRIGINDISAQAVKERQAVDWTRYKARHLAYRMENGLGDKRPLSRWQDNGTCQMPDFFWHGWTKAQTERVWDTLDVNFLRAIARGSDFMSKCRVIDLSQGLDRELDQRAAGISGCLTPRGQHFISTRGGPLLGIEALALQGIPINKLLLSNESQRDLHDLAGNAMSSPVVGAAILCALITGHKALLPGPTSVENSKTTEDIHLQPPACEENSLYDLPIEMVSDIQTARDLLRMAQRSRRLCYCEGQSGTKRRDILRCSKCNHTACVKCGRNPIHVYEHFPNEQLSARMPAIDFETHLKMTLPMRLCIRGLTSNDFEIFRHSKSSVETTQAWESFMQAIGSALVEELRFSDISRQGTWTTTYKGIHSSLKLICSPNGVQWHLFVQPGKQEPSNSPLRQMLSHPVARMIPSSSLFNGPWQIGSPISSEFNIRVAGHGSRVESLGARVGLTDKQFRDTKVWSCLEITGNNEDIAELDLDIRGKYELLQHCGGPFGSLHRKITRKSETPIFFFIDPSEIGPEQLDSWVFATDHSRLDFGQTRELIAQMQPGWNAFEVGEKSHTIKCWHRRWVKSPHVSLDFHTFSNLATYRVITLDAVAETCHSSCKEAHAALLECTVPATSNELDLEPGRWKCSDLIETPAVLQNFAWLLQKAISVTQFANWSPIHSKELGAIPNCSLCAPQKPRLSWARTEKDRLYAYENPEDAAAYEKSVKSRPAPFLGYVSRDESSNLNLRICLNVLTLIHQAAGNILTTTMKSFHWRLCIDTTGFVRQRLPKLTESNNRNDIETSQPPGFKSYKLRPEQLRSLAWMKFQEDHNQPFEEEEVVEALLPVINWRAEGKASTSKLVRGGILGDAVGYGKTAISLALIDAQFDRDSKSAPKMAAGKIPVKATLVIAPNHLFDQWLREIRKFLNSKYRVLPAKTLATLRSLSISEIEKVDIVVASNSIFRGNNYYELMRLFAAAPEVPQGDGRVFDEWLQDCLAGVQKHISLLQTCGGPHVLASIQAQNEQYNEASISKYNPSRRLKGQKLQDHLAKEKKCKENAKNEFESDENVAYDQTITNRAPEANMRKRKKDENEDSTGPESKLGSIPKLGRSKKQKIGSKDKSPTADEVFHFQNAGHDWKRLRNPFIHMFEFNRLVIDEFTYSKERSYSAVLAISARSKWILSGTPPLNDFADVKSFSPFLNVNLGIDEDDIKKTDNERLRAIQKDRTEVEQFQPFITRRSTAWHKRRHDIAQRFLDRFMRKNEPEIGEIPFSEHIYGIVLAPAERALYIELFVQVMSQNLKFRRQGRGLYDAAEISRLNQMVGDSDSAEEALVRRCSLFSVGDMLEDKSTANSSQKRKIGMGHTVLDIRYNEFKDLAADLQTKFRLALWLRSKLENNVKNHFDKTLHLIESNIGAGELGDLLVRRTISRCLEFAKANSKKEDGAHFFATAEMKRQNSKESRPEFPQTEKTIARDLNICNDSIRRLIAETRARTRASRVFQTVRYFQTSPRHANYHCHFCSRILNDRSLVYVLGECGHTLCKPCLELRRAKGDCRCDGCTATLEGYRVIEGSDFAGESQTLDDSWLNLGGNKIGELVTLLQDSSRIPENDQVLLFIQFPELISAVSSILEKFNIRHLRVTSNDRVTAKALADFQNGTEEFKSKVLILALGDVTASGLNLQNANHIIFFHPLIARSQYDYESGMSQAIGRSLRYGQLKHVHIYHLLALKTVEVNIFERRRKECVVKREGMFVSIPRTEKKETDVADWKGAPVEGSNAAVFDDGFDENE